MTHAMFRLRCAAVARPRLSRHAVLRRQFSHPPRLARGKSTSHSLSLFASILPTIKQAFASLFSLFFVDGIVVRRVKHLEDELVVLREQLSHLETQSHSRDHSDPLVKQPHFFSGIYGSAPDSFSLPINPVSQNVPIASPHSSHPTPALNSPAPSSNLPAPSLNSHPHIASSASPLCPPAAPPAPPVAPPAPSVAPPAPPTPPIVPVAPPAPPTVPVAPPAVPVAPEGRPPVIRELSKVTSSLSSDGARPITAADLRSVKLRSRPSEASTSTGKNSQCIGPQNPPSGASFKAGVAQTRGSSHVITAEELQSVRLRKTFQRNDSTRSSQSAGMISVEELRAVKLRHVSDRRRSSQMKKKGKRRRSRCESKIDAAIAEHSLGSPTGSIPAEHSDQNAGQFSLLQKELAKRLKSLCSPVAIGSSHPVSEGEWDSPQVFSSR